MATKKVKPQAPPPAEPKKPSDPLASPASGAQAPPPVYITDTKKKKIEAPSVKDLRAKVLIPFPGQTSIVKNVCKETKTVVVKAYDFVLKPGDTLEMSSSVARKYFSGADYAINTK